MNNIRDLWWQKYRPKTLDELILNKESKDILKSFESNKNIPHLLFTSTAGTGKTSTAKILVNGVLNCDHLYINASEENGIDTIRTKIIGFSQTKSFDGNIKVIILDECLDKDTLVTVLRDGKIKQLPICQLDENNDLVKSYSQVRNRIEYRPFYLWDKSISDDVYEIEFENNETIVCTGDHKWYVIDPITSLPTKMKLCDMIKNGIQDILTFP